MDQLSLGKHKFNLFCLAIGIEFIAEIMMELVDTVVSGHILGMPGLSALNVVGPITSFTIFTENIVYYLTLISVMATWSPVMAAYTLPSL